MTPKSVLIVDDDQSLLQAIDDRLSLEGIKVITALEGKIGLEKVASQNPDLIILDIMLKGELNGFDVLEVLKRNEITAKIPVIVLTNLDSEEKVAKEIGAADYFIKSNTDLDVINKRVKDILGIGVARQ